MRKTVLTTALFGFIAGSVAAETRLETFERVSEAANNYMVASMIDMAEEEGADRAALEAVFEPLEWDDTFRTSGQCMLDAYDAEIGADKTDEMIAEMDAMFIDAMEQDLSIDEMAERGEGVLPEGMSMSRSIEITQECGMTELQMQWMSETGIMQAMFEAAN